jgi:hypothetical protein
MLNFLVANPKDNKDFFHTHLFFDMNMVSKQEQQ